MPAEAYSPLVYNYEPPPDNIMAWCLDARRCVDTSLGGTTLEMDLEVHSMRQPTSSGCSSPSSSSSSSGTGRSISPVYWSPFDKILKSTATKSVEDPESGFEEGEEEVGDDDDDDDDDDYINEDDKEEDLLQRPGSVEDERLFDVDPSITLNRAIGIDDIRFVKDGFTVEDFFNKDEPVDLLQQFASSRDEPVGEYEQVSRGQCEESPHHHQLEEVASNRSDPLDQLLTSPNHEHQQAPANGEELSGQQQQVPANGGELPGQQQQVPANGEELPGQQQQVPANGGELPGQQQQVPANGEELPGHQQQVALIVEQPSVSQCEGLPSFDTTMHALFIRVWEEGENLVLGEEQIIPSPEDPDVPVKRELETPPPQQLLVPKAEVMSPMHGGDMEVKQEPLDLKPIKLEFDVKVEVEAPKLECESKPMLHPPAEEAPELECQVPPYAEPASPSEVHPSGLQQPPAEEAPELECAEPASPSDVHPSGLQHPPAEEAPELECAEPASPSDVLPRGHVLMQPPAERAAARAARKRFASASSTCSSGFGSGDDMDIPRPAKQARKKRLDKSPCNKTLVKPRKREDKVKDGDRCPRSGTCSICHNSYQRLDKHRLLHLGEKPYKCDICGEKFRQTEHLRRHLEVHKGKNRKTFPCSRCGKVLTRKDKLKEHLLKCRE